MAKYVLVSAKTGDVVEGEYDDGIVPPPEPTPEEIRAAQIAAFRRAVQAYVDATAQSRDYDSGNSLASYTASTVEAWRAEAEAFVAWRDAVWSDVIERLAQVEAGDVEPPESPDALIASLPDIDWP